MCLPQIDKNARDPNGASAISYSTGVFGWPQIDQLAVYSICDLGDATMGWCHGAVLALLASE
jgi:hypothetical protein